MPTHIDHRHVPPAVVSTFTGLPPVRVVMFQRTETRYGVRGDLSRVTPISSSGHCRSGGGFVAGRRTLSLAPAERSVSGDGGGRKLMGQTRSDDASSRPGAKAPAATDLPEDWKHLLRTMLSIRYFEDQVKGLFGSGLVRGSTHLCQGQEAVSVGVCSLLTPGDVMTCTYRGHGAVLAAGAAMDASFAEILGRQGGLCGGKGGSMHLADLEKGIIGSNAIVGAHLPDRRRARASPRSTARRERCAWRSPATVRPTSAPSTRA